MARGLLSGTATVINTMLSRVATCWLIVLVLAPFTAPFPTCDLARLFGGEQTRQAPAPVPASPMLEQESAIASVPAISGAGRIRLSSVSGVPGSTGECLVVPRASARAGGRRDTGLATILRV